MPALGTHIREVVSRSVDFEFILHESDIQMRNYYFYKIFPINSGFW